ncbi:hypothetical protein GUJ93_ZPchr0007g5951 [Zizania palustris]|uniref:Uncharacterized protein n=1 Tax=Zizania palustris TaxID=103762 RepID=A0A8J5TCS1_ZIZPA|nr:hypothetical protein GUJ93_ZPchr0007g5951 [Zizania palustris]
MGATRASARTANSPLHGKAAWDGGYPRRRGPRPWCGATSACTLLRRCTQCVHLGVPPRPAGRVRRDAIASLVARALARLPF